MARYVYEGPGPQEDPDGGIARPGDVREFDAEPAWGPWRPEGAVSDPAAPAVPSPAPGAGSPGAGQDAPGAGSSASAPAGGE